MGSICCVPARPQTATGNINGCSNIVDELHCCSTGGFSPRLGSQQWEKHENSRSHSQMDRTSVSSSRSGSGRFVGHQHTPSDSICSHGASPTGSFSMSQWSSNVPYQSGNFADLITATTGEMSSSPSITLGSQKDGVSYTGLSPLASMPESNVLHKQGDKQHVEELSPIVKNQQNLGFLPPLPRLPRPASCRQYSTPEEASNSRGLFSRSRHSFRWSRNKRVDSNSGSLDSNSDWWSVQTFSELVASSPRERLRWTRAKSPSDFGYACHRKSMEKAANYPVERIRAYSSELISVAPAETHKCSLCSKLLSDSPTNSNRIFATNDLTVVGVLSCGHVFHSICLEEVTPEARKQDPPCPQCEAATKFKTRNIAELSPPSKIGWMANTFHGQSSSRNKLSRIVAADNLSEQELHCCSTKSKGKLLMLDDTSEKRQHSLNTAYPNAKVPSRKLLSRKTFSFKGKTFKDVLMGDRGRKISGSSSEVSPERNFGRRFLQLPIQSNAG